MKPHSNILTDLSRDKLHREYSMQHVMLKSKIHRAMLAGEALGCEGSIAVDEVLLQRRVSFIRFWFRRTAFCLATLAMLAFVAAAPSDKVYTVRRGETLWGIAQTHGLPLTQLAERNGLSKNYHVYAGQRLVIPAKVGARKTRTSPRLALPASVQRAIGTAPVKAGRWKYIVIHHSGVDCGTLRGIDRYHRDERHMPNGLGYHFVLGNGNGMGDGEIGVGPRWTQQLDGGHLISQSQNKISLGICLVGNFESHKPTAKQLQRLTALVQALLTRCKLPPVAVKTHQQINVVHTRCPGRHFPTKSFLASLESKP